MSTLLRRSDIRLAAYSPFDAFGEQLDPEPEPRSMARAEPQPLRVVVTADNHLSPALPRLSPQRRAQRRARLRTAFAHTVTFAIEHGAALFVMAGDVFDTPMPSNVDRAFLGAQLARLRGAGIVCVAISGNHDLPRSVGDGGAQAPLQVYAALGALDYFAEQTVLRPKLYELHGLRLALGGLTYNQSAAPGSDPLAGLRIEDTDGVLGRAEVGLLVLHGAIEGLCPPTEGERVILGQSLERLPAPFRVAVAGHIHRFGRRRCGKVAAVMCGASERMEFGTASGNAGFAWLEIGPAGLLRAEHVPIQEQPRADVLVETARLWPRNGRATQAPASHVAAAATIAEETETLAAVARMEDAASWAAGADLVAPPSPLAVVQMELGEVCSPDTMVRLRLSGALTREQYHQLALRDILLYGQQHAFTFDLDTSGLAIADSLPALASAGQAPQSLGPISPADEVARIVEERITALGDGAATSDEAQLATGTAADDLRAAADMLLGRLRAAAEGEGEA